MLKISLKVRLGLWVIQICLDSLKPIRHIVLPFKYPSTDPELKLSQFLWTN